MAEDVDRVRRVLVENPEIIAEAIRSNPQVILEIFKLSGLGQLQNLATREDIKALREDLKLIIEVFNKRFEDINRRFEDINRRFEDMNRRFEDLRYYVDRRLSVVERIVIGFNIPILAAVIAILIRMLIF